MDPFSILAIAGTAMSIAHKSYEAGEMLGMFIHDVKNVDQTMKGMQSEIKALGAACNTVGTRVRGIAESIDADSNTGSRSEGAGAAPLWVQVRTQLDDCGETVAALNDALEGVAKERKKNPFAQAWRQFQLNLRAKDIDEARQRIRSHTASLQLVLQAITLEVSYLAPQRADQQLVTLLENIRDIKQELSKMQDTARAQEMSEKERQHELKEAELLSYTDKIISSGETLYEGSIAGGSVIGPSADLDDKITSWVSRLQVLSEEPTRHIDNDFDTPPGSAVSGTDASTDLTFDSGIDVRSGGSASKMLDSPLDDEFGEDEGDDLQIEMIRDAYNLGVTEFENKAYRKANELLQEVLTMVEESPVRSSRMVDVRQLRWMLAICAYHLDDFQTAEVALKEIVQIPPQGQEDRVRLCEAGHILALASLKQDKLSEARQYCDSALQGRRRLLGKTDQACFESLALLARIFELQDNGARAALYARMIPDDQRDAICAQYKTLGGQASASTAPETQSTASNNKDKELPPLPPGPPPPGPPSSTTAEPTQETANTATNLPPDQKWRFRPPIPTKRPVEYVPSKKDESDDDEDPFAAQKAQEAQEKARRERAAQDKSMQEKVSQIVGDDVKDPPPPFVASPPAQEDLHVYRAATWTQPNVLTEADMKPQLPRTHSAATSRAPPARQSSVSAAANARAPPYAPAPAPLPAYSSQAQSYSPQAQQYSPQVQPYIPQAHSASQRTVQLNEIFAFQADIQRAKRGNSKKSPAVINALRNYASAVHDFDLNDHEARSLHEDVLAQAKGSVDEGDPLVYKTYANLAKIAEAQGDFNKSSDLYQKVLDGMKKNPSNDDGIFKTTVQSQLAEAFLNISKPERAYSVLRDELKTRRRVYGSRLRSVETADCAKRLAEVRNVLISASAKPYKHHGHAAKKARKQGSIDDAGSVASVDSAETQSTASTGMTAPPPPNMGLNRSMTVASESVSELLKNVHPALASRVASVMSPPPQQR